MYQWFIVLTAALAIGVLVSADTMSADAADSRTGVQILIVAHGMPPTDFPPEKMSTFFRLHELAHDCHEIDKRVSTAVSGKECDSIQKSYLALDAEMRNWPRTPENDPFKSDCDAIAGSLHDLVDIPVVVAYNEFCAPAIEGAIAAMAASGARRIIVMTTMLTQGGDHSEIDIPESLNRARREYPGIELVYAWPYSPDQIADMLLSQFNRFHNEDSE
jgi:sirohydrochlorin cobaltochelatase